jgi:hypothetical protein
MQGSNALDNFMKLNGYPKRAEYNRNGFWNSMETVSRLSDCHI